MKNLGRLHWYCIVHDIKEKLAELIRPVSIQAGWGSSCYIISESIICDFSSIEIYAFHYRGIE